MNLRPPTRIFQQIAPCSFINSHPITDNYRPFIGIASSVEIQRRARDGDMLLTASLTAALLLVASRLLFEKDSASTKEF